MASTDSTSDRLAIKLAEGAEQLSIKLDDEQSRLLIQFIRLIAKWNRVHNLTAVRSVDEMVGRHILDSLSVLQWMPDTNMLSAMAANLSNNAATTNVLDVGTGAGLPVIPLAIMRPDLQFLSIESNGKKCRFQHQAITELKLENIRITQARIEDVNELAHVVVSRAFTAPDKFLQVVEKNCLIASEVIVMLGTKEKMPDALPSPFSLLEMKKIDVPQLDSTRYVAVCLRN